MRNFGIIPQGLDVTPCRHCPNPIASLHEYQCAHDMGTEYAPCKRLARKKLGRRLEIAWVLLATVIGSIVIFLLHNR